MLTFNQSIIAFTLCTLTFSCSQLHTINKVQQTPQINDSNNQLVLTSQVNWTYLNPARKDKAPLAATLWGNRQTNEATGFLLKPKDGFQSPPHIHNVSYRGIVIEGAIHNDDPNADKMWMPAGSFWTQPKGHVHITAAQGNNALAYIEIEAGPYLVKPQQQAFDGGERPVNIDKSNIVWLSPDNLNWSQTSNLRAQIAYLWGKPGQHSLSGYLLKLPTGFEGKIKTSADSFKGVVIKGAPTYQSKRYSAQQLTAGSYFDSQGDAFHQLASNNDTETLLYIRASGEFSIVN